MNEREREARDEHHFDFGFGPDLSPREKAKAEIMVQERLMTLEDEAKEIVGREFCPEYGCPFGKSCGGFPCEAAKEEIELMVEDLKSEMTSLTENENDHK